MYVQAIYSMFNVKKNCRVMLHRSDLPTIALTLILIHLIVCNPDEAYLYECLLIATSAQIAEISENDICLI